MIRMLWFYNSPVAGEAIAFLEGVKIFPPYQVSLERFTETDVTLRILNEVDLRIYITRDHQGYLYQIHRRLVAKPTKETPNLPNLEKDAKLEVLGLTTPDIFDDMLTSRDRDWIIQFVSARFY